MAVDPMCGDAAGMYHDDAWLWDTDVMKAICRIQLVVACSLVLLAMFTVVTNLDRYCTKDAFESALQTYLPVFTKQATTQEELRVQELADAKDLDFWRAMVRVCAKACTVYVGLQLVWELSQGRLVAQILDGDTDASTTATTVLFSGFSSAIYVLLSGLAFKLADQKSLLTKRSLHCWILLSQMRFLLPLALNMPLHHFHIYTRVALPVRMVLSLHANLGFVVCINGVIAVLQIYVGQHIYVENGLECVKGIVTAEIGCCILICIICCIHRQQLLYHLRCTLGEETSNGVGSAVETLLNGLCDAVVRLDDKLDLWQSSLELDALLLRRSTSAGVPRERSSFLNLMFMENDAARFEEFARRPMEEGQLPGTIHVTMRDSNHSPVWVQLYHTAYSNAAGELLHIVGVRECGDRECGDLHGSHSDEIGSWSSDEAGNEAQAVQDQWAPAAGKEPLHPSASTGRPSEASSGRSVKLNIISEISSSGPETDQVLPLAASSEYQQDEVAVWVDSSRSELPMCQCTPEFFSSLGGPSLKVGSKLLLWVQGRDRALVKTLIRDALQRVVPVGRDGDLAKVCFQPPHMGNNQFTAQIRVTGPVRRSWRNRAAAASALHQEGQVSSASLVKITCHKMRHKGCASRGHELTQVIMASRSREFPALGGLVCSEPHRGDSLVTL